MAAARVDRKEKKKKKKRDQNDRGCPDVARGIEPQASNVAAAAGIAAPTAAPVAAPTEAAPAVAEPSPAVVKHTEEATGTRQKKSNNKKEKKMKRKRGGGQENDGTDRGAEDQASRLAAAAAVKTNSTTTPGRALKAIVDGPGNTIEGDILSVDEASQGEKPAKKRRKKGKHPPSAVPPVRPPLVAKPFPEPAAAAPSNGVGSASPPALLCTGKVDEYQPTSGEQSAGKGAGDRRGRSSPQGNSSRAKKKKDRRARLLRPGGGSIHPQGGRITGSKSTGDDTSDKDNHNDSNRGDNHNNNVNNVNNIDNDQAEDEALEGVVHGGAMFLVDARRRVFSTQRNERGDLVKVGRFDDDRGEVVLEKRLQPSDGNPPEARVGVGAVSEAGAGVEALGTAAKALSKRPTSAEMDKGTTSGVSQGGSVAGGSATTVGGAKTEVVRSGKKKKKKKKKKKTETGVVGEDGAVAGDGEENAGGGKLPGAGPRDVVEYPFEVEECDHCETGDLAYAHIAPILSAIAAELGKTAEELVIYDPYFCQGSTIRRLASLGFPRVYNRNEDFYEAVKSGTIPEYDVLVTNPPFSGEHVPKILSFCARQGAKPWLLLMPNYVYLKDYYEPSLTSEFSRGAALPFYLTPPKRYMYYSPQGSRVNVKSSERKTSPFNTFWYIRLGDGSVTSKILQAYEARSRKPESEPRCCIARTTQQIPYKMMDSNDPRRKKARDRQRSIDRIRKKKSEWVVD